MAMIDESTTWDSLRLMRLHGQKPALPVIVTSKPHLPQRLAGVGCLVILHRAGEVMPVKLLDGLDVIFNFDRCELVTHVMHLAKAKGVTFERTRAWCGCANLLTILPMSCWGHGEMVKWAEGDSAP